MNELGKQILEAINKQEPQKILETDKKGIHICFIASYVSPKSEYDIKEFNREISNLKKEGYITLSSLSDREPNPNELEAALEGWIKEHKEHIEEYEKFMKEYKDEFEGNPHNYYTNITAKGMKVLGNN
ncbi:MAG: hypothetical protein P9M13_05425 [Candidatus Ancaeobacter aquaticus]|nr:hypothetical protein [Candidatus Ancaeobacter aquaticus]